MKLIRVRRFGLIVSSLILISCQDQDADSSGKGQRSDEASSSVVEKVQNSTKIDNLLSDYTDLEESSSRLSDVDLREKGRNIFLKIKGLGISELEDLCLKIINPPNHLLLQKVLARIAELDSDLCLEMLTKVEPSEQFGLYNETFLNLMISNPEIVFDFIIDNSTKFNATNFRFAVAGLVSTRPEEAYRLAVLGKSVLGKGRGGILPSFVAEMAKINADIALDFLNKNDEINEDFYRVVLADVVMKSDPLKAIGIYKTAIDQSRVIEKCVACYRQLSLTDPKAAHEKLALESQGILQIALAESQIQQSIIAEDPELLFQLFSKLPLSGGTFRTLQSAVVELTKTDPAGTVDWILEFPESSGSKKLLNTTMESWAVRDLSAAKEYLSELPENEVAIATAGLVSGWSITEPGEAFQWAVDQKIDPTMKLELVKNGLNAGMRGQSRAVLDILKSNEGIQLLGNDPEYAGLITGGLKKLTSSSVAEAKTWIESVSDPTILEAAGDGFVQGWVATDLDAAQTWVNSLNEGKLRAGAQRALDRELQVFDK